MADLPIPSLPGIPESSRSDALRSGARTSARAAPKTSENQEAQDARPAFKVLLEMLQDKARALEEQTKRVDDASLLAGAVEGARSSLEEALSLGEELLESFRQNRQQTLDPSSPTRSPGQERT